MITFSDIQKSPDSDVISWNVDKDDEPFGQIWTFKKKRGHVWSYHAKCLDDRYKECKSLKSAMQFMKECGKN